MSKSAERTEEIFAAYVPGVYGKKDVEFLKTI
jgi:hypothetical protein